MTIGVGAGLVVATAVGCGAVWLDACFSREQAALKAKLAAIKTLPPAIWIRFMAFKSTFEIGLILRRFPAVQLGQFRESLVYTSVAALTIFFFLLQPVAPNSVHSPEKTIRLNFFRRSAKMNRPRPNKKPRHDAPGAKVD